MKFLKITIILGLTHGVISSAEARMQVPPDNYREYMRSYYHNEAQATHGAFSKLKIREKQDGRTPIRWKPKDDGKASPNVTQMKFLPPRQQAELERLQRIVTRNGCINTQNLGQVMAAYLAAGMPQIAETEEFNKVNPLTGLVCDPEPFHKYGVGFFTPPQPRLKRDEALRKALLVRGLAGAEREAHQMPNRSRYNQRGYTDVRTLFPQDATACCIIMPHEWIKNLSLRSWVAHWERASEPVIDQRSKGVSSQEKNWVKRRRVWDQAFSSL